MNQIELLWKRIAEWMRINAPFLLTTLNPGATSDQIKTFEGKFGFNFPDDYKTLLLLSNGQKPPPADHFGNIGYFCAQNSLSMEASFKKWQELVNSQDPDIQEAFLRSFIPLAGVVDPIVAMEAKSERIHEVFVTAPDWTLPPEWQIFQRVRFQKLSEYLEWVLNRLQLKIEYAWIKEEKRWIFI